MTRKRENGSIFAIFLVVAIIILVAAVVIARRTGPENQPLESTTKYTNNVQIEHRELTGWPDRPYFAYLPEGFSSQKTKQAILMLHGGGSNSSGQQKLTCPDGNLDSPQCF